MLAASAYSLLKARHELSLDGLGQIVLGFVTAFVVALLVVRAVIAIIGRIGFTPFGWYRIGLGLVMLAALAIAG
jgi:undecaprenyl-diphosphatase